MTGAQKNTAARFLALASASLRGGWRSPREQYDFLDDAAESTADAAPPSEASPPCATALLSGAPPLNEAAALDSLDAVAAAIQRCTACPLCAKRVHAVPGEGVPKPLVLVVGEGPGADEDASGRPFVGRAGQLLDKMLASVGISRAKNCFIANIVKCRPPGNRDPEPPESAACLPFLRRQIELLRPRVILSAGRVSAMTLLATGEGISRLRGIWKQFEGIPLLPTFHPSYLLRAENQKALAWEDMKSLCRRVAELDAGYEAETAALRSARRI